uniref:Uncharacterized protein n=1 Tax=Cyclophora tenuis TaxID=216820 RepID=A0A7S1CX95_CYCTE|mmetsp:Transcript_13017/g.22118  ORF Transcript_13017/g.22118 Transcript_13017/m.22118 type:complete len:114 (+) Transcript_13017:170-511(+)
MGCKQSTPAAVIDPNDPYGFTNPDSPFTMPSIEVATKPTTPTVGSPVSEASTVSTRSLNHQHSYDYGGGGSTSSIDYNHNSFSDHKHQHQQQQQNAWMYNNSHNDNPFVTNNV